MTVSYPYLNTTPGATRILKYRFLHDPVANTYTIHCNDSTQFREDLYGNQNRTKTYYLTNSNPQRVYKITVRMWSQIERGEVQPQENYDLVFDFPDNYPFPNAMTTTVYDDTAGTAIHFSVRDSVGIYDPPNYHYQGLLNILDFTYSPDVLRTPLSDLSGACCQLTRYTDSSYELINRTPELYSSLFYGTGMGNGTYLFSLYQFDKNGLLTSLPFDVTSLTGIMAPGDQWVVGQQKFDFHYTNTNPLIKKLFNITGMPEAIVWEEWTELRTKVNERWGWDGYSYTDPYVVSSYAYYQNICDSYTDSLFTVNADFTKTLISTESFTNTVSTGADGNISSITKTRQDGAIMRYIVLGYE